MTVSRFRSAIVAALLFTATAALAAEPSPADKETARALMSEGRQKRDTNDLQAALKAFRAADSIMHVPTTAIEVAKTEALAGLLLEARDHALTLARSKAQPGEPGPFADARTAAQQLANELDVRIPSVRFTLTGAKDDAEIRIDDVAIPSAANALPRKLNPGSHLVVVKSGGAERRATFKVSEKETKELTLDFVQPPVADVPVDKPPPVDNPPPVVVPPPVAPDTPSSGNGTKTALIVGGFSVGAVGIIAGSVTGILSLNKTSDLQAQCPGGRCPANLQSDLDGARTLATVSTVAFIFGGAGAVVGVIGLLLPKSAAAAPTVGATAAHASVEPWIGVGAVGLRGVF